MLAEEGINKITPTDISERFDYKDKPSTRTIGKHLKGLGLQTIRKRVDGKTKNIVVINQEVINLAKKYVSDEELVTRVTFVTSDTLSCTRN